MVNILGIIAVFGVVLIWAMASVVYKQAIGNKTDVKADPLAALAMRILLVTIFMFGICLIFEDVSAPFQLPPEKMRLYILASILGAVFTLASDTLYFLALQYLDSSRVYPIVNTQVLFTFPVAALLFGEIISPFMWISGILMIIGVSFISKGDNLDKGMEKISDQSKQKRYIIGISMAILVGMFYAFQYLAMTYAIRLSDGILVANFYRLFGYFILYWVYILITKSHFPLKRKTPEEKSAFKGNLICGIMGCISLGLADSLYQVGVKLNNASTSIVIGANAPIFNQIFAIMFLKEKFRPRILIGVIIIIIANILVIF